jgi:uncharacterized protein YkwD
MTKSLILGLALVAHSLPAIAATVLRPDLSRVEALVIEGTNDFRRKEQRVQVTRDARLEDAARDFAAFMARTDKFSHEADGSTPSARARSHGYDFCLVSENIFYQYGSAGFETADLARRFVEGWKNSPGHRKNMLEPDVIHTAVAVAHGAVKGVQRYYAVQMFGRPRSAAVVFSVSNTSPVPVEYRVGDRPFVVQPRSIRTHTECSAQALAFDLPGDADARAPKFATRNGDKFVVARDRKTFSVKRE